MEETERMFEVYDAKGKKVCICDEANGMVTALYKGRLFSAGLSVGNNVMIDHGGAVTRITRDTPTSFKIERSLHGDTQAGVKTK